MVVARPQIVILDEATSALDSDTERRLHQALFGLHPYGHKGSAAAPSPLGGEGWGGGAFLAGRTTLIIAHRLSAVKQADRILVFENGRVVEEGGHDELIHRGGLYHKLYQHP
jgi:ATP-binding cassette subfamily C protein